MADQPPPLIEAAQPKVLALDLSAVFDIEYSALKMVIEAEERLRERGILLGLVALNPEALAIVQRSTLGETLGRERLFFNLQAAVERDLPQNSAQNFDGGELTRIRAVPLDVRES